MTSRIVFCTSGSGGVGKSTGARWLACAAARDRRRVVLVDGNPGQQSQRAALKLDKRWRLEDARLKGLKAALVPPKTLHAPFALLAGPADPHDRDALDLYAEAIEACADMADLIVVDADRMDGRAWNDRRSFAGSVMRPMVEHMDARILFRLGRLGSQLDDGLNALDALGHADRTGVLGVEPGTVRAWPARKWRRYVDGLGVLLGVDAWDARSARVVASRAVGLKAGVEPDWLREATAWATT